MVDLILYGAIVGVVFFGVLGVILIIIIDDFDSQWYGLICFLSGGGIALLAWWVKGFEPAIYGTGAVVASILAIVAYLILSRWL